MVKKLALVALLVASSAHAEFMTGNQLLNDMNGDHSDRMLALGYVMGVHDSTRNVTHCSPPNVIAGQVRDMVKKHLESNPSNRHFSADSIINFLLLQTWPCPKKSNSQSL